MSEARWKRTEREIADFFGTRRILRKGDSVADFHTDLVVGEVKSRAKLPKWLIEAMAQVKSYNLLGNRLPILCLKARGMHGFLVVIHSTDFKDYFGDLIDNENGN